MIIRCSLGESKYGRNFYNRFYTHPKTVAICGQFRQKVAPKFFEGVRKAFYYGGAIQVKICPLLRTGDPLQYRVQIGTLTPLQSQ